MRKVTHILGLFISVIILISCNNQGKDIKHYSTYFKTADYLLHSHEYDQASLYVDSIRNFCVCDTPEVVQVFADYLQSWVSTYDLDEDSAIIYARKAFNGFLPFGDKFSEEVCGLSLILAYNCVVTYPDSSIYYSDVCLSQSGVSTQRIVYSHLYKAEAYRNLKRFDDCLFELQRIQAITDTIMIDDNEETAAWMLYTLTECADMSCFVGDYRLCNNYLADAARWYDLTSSTDDHLSYLLCRARTHFIQSHYSLAMNYANRLDDMAVINEDPIYRVNALAIKGLIHVRNNEINEAIVCQDKIDSLVLHDPSIKKESIHKEGVYLLGEIAAYKGDLKESRRLLFDSIQNDSRSFEYDQVLKSRQAYYLALKDYKSLYLLEEQCNAYVDSIQTNIVFKNEQMLNKQARDVSELLREKIRTQAKALSAQSSTLLLERLIFVSIVVIIASLVLVSMRRNVKNRTSLMLVEKKRLENEIADKIKALEQQKEMFRRTNQRISESISYAERIQHSIMPLPEALNNYDIEGSFIFNSPLDVVSGDFYWFAQKGDNLLVACADCTGHGVPGAFMSMIASTTINEVVQKSNDDVTPAEILEIIDQRIVENLAHNTSESGAAKDGLDIALISINLKTLELVTSAARRPIIITRDQEMVSVPATKRSIGDIERLFRKRDFVNERFQLHRGDNIYMFSDGYSDQFGGPEGDKLKVSRIKKFLRAIHDDEIEEQSLTIQELFTQWKGDYPQIDDVLFIGIKL